MNAAETIAAAIEKLEGERAKAMQGPWFRLHPLAIVKVQAASAEIVAGQAFDDRNADLIVTLRRTIDAQLAILRETQFQLSGAPQARGFIGNEFTLFVRLADAILGVTS